MNPIKYLLMLIFSISGIGSEINASLFDPKQSSSSYVEVMKKFDVDPYYLKDRAFLSKFKSISTKNRQNSFFVNLEQALNFVPILREKINAAGIPEEFLYLAMAESNFSPSASSHKRAKGLWQFMPATGRKYGLRIDDYVDERKDILKSTDAAITYLKDLHGMFGKWYLAAMAYNCGENRVKWAIKKSGSNDLKVLLTTNKKRKRQYLPKETRDYIRKILSFALLVQETELFTNSANTHLLNRGKSVPIRMVNVGANVHLSDVSEVLNMKYEDLFRLNPHLRYKITPPDVDSYNIYIPYSRLAFFKSSKGKIKPSSSGFRIHIVKRGDTLYDLSRAFGISVDMIKLSNNLKSNVLSLNQKLIIPVAGEYLGNEKRRRHTYYRVRSGDTLSKISHKFKVKVEDIIRQNNLHGHKIKIGDKLVIQN